MSDIDGKGVDLSNIAIAIESVGNSDEFEYTKSDFAVGCKLGEAYAFSFYQFDYQSIVNSATTMAATSGVSVTPLRVTTKPIPVAKVVMDQEGFRKLLSEVNKIARKVGISE